MCRGVYFCSPSSSMKVPHINSPCCKKRSCCCFVFWGAVDPRVLSTRKRLSCNSLPQPNPTQPQGRTGNDKGARTRTLGSCTTRKSKFLLLQSIGSPRKDLVPMTLVTWLKTQQFLARVRLLLLQSSSPSSPPRCCDISDSAMLPAPPRQCL